MAWGNSFKLKIDHTKVDSALTDFPVLVHLSNSSGITDFDVTDIFTELGANRKKIKIETSGSQQCYVEIERWDNTNNEAWLWVKVPSVSASADTELTLYYDSSEADNTTYVGDTGDTPAQNVWDSDFVGVWHMAQDPTGGSGCIKDSTSNANHGTPSGSMTSGDLVDGKIGKALDFDGSDDLINCGSDTSLDVTGSYALEAIAEGRDWNKNEIITGRYDDGANNGFMLSLLSTTDKMRAVHRVSPSVNSLTTISAVTSGLHHIVNRFDNGVGSELFLDGVTQGTDTTVTTGISSFAQDFLIGAQDYVSEPRNFTGKIDEVRLSKAARSDAWIKATHHSNFDLLITFETGTETEVLEDISLDLSAYYQSLENFGTWLRAHDGLEFEDLVSNLEAAGWTTEDLSSYLSAWYQSLEDAGLSLNTWGTGYEDLQSWLAAYHRSLEDAKTDLSIVATAYEHWTTFLWAVATVRKDLASSLQVYGRELQDLPSFLRAVGYQTEDLKGYFEAVSSTVIVSFGLYLTATDGVTLSDLCVNLTAIKKSPQFKSVVAQRVSSVISEVV